jgi:hypothetical protein
VVVCIIAFSMSTLEIESKNKIFPVDCNNFFHVQQPSRLIHHLPSL